MPTTHWEVWTHRSSSPTSPISPRARTASSPLADLRAGRPDRQADSPSGDGRLDQRRSRRGCIAWPGRPTPTDSGLRIGCSASASGAGSATKRLLRFIGLDRSDPDAVEFTIERGRHPTRLPWPVHTTTMVAPSDFVVVDGFRTTSATRTVIDLAHARARRTRVEAAFDSAVRLGLSHPIVLAERLDDPARLWAVGMHADRPHPPRRRWALAVGANVPSPGPRSRPHSTHHAGDSARRGSGRHVARVDFLFEAQRLIVEVTGRLGHVSDAERARDAQRRNELQDLGFTVIEYTSTQIRERSRG